MNDRELAGQVAIVTGTSRKRGLGRALALALAAAGADIVACGAPNGAARLTDEEREAGWRGVPSLVDEVRELGGRALALEVDLRSGGEVERMVERAAHEFGHVDILVNNAAYPRGGDRVPLVDLPDDTWRAVVDVNLTATMLCCKYVARRMIAQKTGGSIVSMSTNAALNATASFSAYSASKAGIHALNGTLAAELGPHGITCNVVAPGFLDTARVDMLRTGDLWARRVERIPVGRAGTPEEVAQAVRFLCGPSARWLTGEVLVIDGGEVRRTAR
ncbi:MAG TPA: SDR family oxidoreductase [Ramlibacter sp.]|uniref:SDR family NAD(P)-dependent oxidoreductase n=1 Tax=Ramlibacter sp. TaxID=1917967 RepID=UPI002CAC4039|nr:SDR family oxidoreductase [Ramlibacter sp.]HVZ42651.1 SDR family oxidoreductase [Ramlibacter sp.]